MRPSVAFHEGSALASLSPQAPYQVVIEFFTDDCNLRCVYCAMHTDKTDFPEYPRNRISSEVVQHLGRLLAEDRPESINLSGNGETTLLEGWTEICEPFLSFNHVGIISNLAKILTQKEAATLARLASITTSIDTADAKLLREIRKPVQLRNIVLNLCLVRSAAVTRGHLPPAININCTLTTKTYRDLVQLVALAAALGVREIAFSDLFETPTSVAHGVRSVATLQPSALAQAATEVRQARALAARNQVTMTINPQLEALLGLAGASKPVASPGQMLTVQCLQPWDGFWVNADGRVSYCCRHMGTTDEDIRSFASVREVLNHRNALQLREALLSGSCPARCRSCELGLPTEPIHFWKIIRARERSQKIRRSQVMTFARKVPFVRPLWKTFKRVLSA
jgi:molybdenum cofactor biosynthesis enzyme MoaA